MGRTQRPDTDQPNDIASTLPKEITKAKLCLFGCAIFGGLMLRPVAGQAHLAHAHFQGIGAALVGNGRLMAQGMAQLWREDSYRLFKYSVLVLTTAGAAGLFHELALAPAVAKVIGISDEHASERNLRWHVGVGVSSLLLGFAMFLPNAADIGYNMRTLPPLKEFLVDRVLKGKHHFYAALPASVLCTFVEMFVTEMVRVRMMYWHKTTFFADLMPGHHDEDDGEDHEEMQSTASADRQMAYWASATLVYLAASALGAAVLEPTETVMDRMVAQADVYGPLGFLGTVASIYRSEGVWGFFQGFLPNFLALALFNYTGLEKEADSGKLPR